MQIKLQSNDYHVLVNTLGAELNSYSSPEGKEYIWNSDPTYWLRSSPLLIRRQRQMCIRDRYISDAQTWFLQGI